MQIQAIKTKIFREGDDLFDFIIRHIKKLPEKSVLVITSKIVALSEKRTAVFTDKKTKEKLIKSESELAIKTKYAWLTIKDGQVMASAGIDESNAKGKLILLPGDSYKSAQVLQSQLKKHFKLKNLGILITDNRTIPLRAGIVGVSLGYFGFRGIKDYRGQKDIFGRRFHFSRTDIADSLAAAAVLAMGEGNERKPLAIITDAPIKFCQKIKKSELYINIKDDMYRPLFDKISKK